MKLLFTGATGFLGTNIMPLLKEKYEVVTAGIEKQNDYVVNFATTVPDFNEKFDIVLHAAGKAHVVPRTEEEKKAFFDVNFNGTRNLCEALEKNGVPKSIIFISTVAVYGLDFGENITEDAPLNGNTPYAKSKKMAEEFLKEWCDKHNVVLGVIRPSLIAGPNPPGNLKSMIDGIKTGRYLSIAGGKAHKSVLMVQDIATLVPLLAEKGGTYNVCDDEQPTFRQLETLIAKQLDKSVPMNIPFWVAWMLAKAGDCLGKKAPINSLKLKKITESLTFSNNKAKKELGWKPSNVISNFRIN